MNTIIIVSLVAVAAFLGSGWMSSKNDNSELRVHIAALKRQLARKQTLN